MSMSRGYLTRDLISLFESHDHRLHSTHKWRTWNNQKDFNIFVDKRYFLSQRSKIGWLHKLLDLDKVGLVAMLKGSKRVADVIVQ